MDLITNDNKTLNILDFRKNFLEFIDVNEKTVETYDIALRQFAEYLNSMMIKKPTREDIIQYREYLKENHKPNTVNSYLIAVRNFFDYLEYEGIYKNVTKNIKNIKIENKHIKRGLSAEEIKKVLDCCRNNKERLIVRLGISCALRSNEIVNIKVSDFYRDGETIMLNILGKGRGGYKQDKVKIDNRLYESIKEYIKEYHINEYLFTSESNNSKGKQLTTRTIRKMIKEIFELAELDSMEMLSAHSLRHTACDAAIESGLSMVEVSESMRHSNISTTMIYKNELDKKNSLFSEVLCDMMF